MVKSHPNANVPKVKGCVYLALCRANAKIYIGKTVKCLWDRVDEHFALSRKRPDRPFQHALHKYGRDLFRWYVLFESTDNQELLDEEVRLISEFRANHRKHGYNVTDGGEGISGFKFSESSIQKRIDGFAQTITFKGETLTIRQWSEKLRINYATLRIRLKRGWPLKYALRKTAKRFHYRPNNRKGTLYELNGERKKLSEWAKILGTRSTTLDERIKKGWPIEKVLSTPVRKKAANGS